MQVATADDALVSAVIPTRHRPKSLRRAVESALMQTYPVAEVVVVMDGPDPLTESMLQAVNEPRIRRITLPFPVGASDARNAGVAAAHSEWIAFLDDDDEWLPHKIERQLAALPHSHDDPIVSCRFIARTDSGDFIWPGRLPQPSEPLCEYLLARRGLRRNDGFIATPTILTRRSLLCRVPFRSGLKKHQDWDWILRATKSAAQVLFSPEVLAKCEMRTHTSTSRSPDWRFSLKWIEENRALVTRRAYSGFVTTHVAWQAAAQQEWRAFLPLLCHAGCRGSLAPADLLRYLGFWTVPGHARRWLRRMP
ncbi:MAG TPA: glycosyltransferase family 2 protein [Terriglobales bacterium]|nr:glycosyltransferase family 2 protein [Terriglobales bacterium]